MLESNVRSVKGVPPAGAFGSKGGTPIVVDRDSATAYVLDTDGNVVALGTGTTTSVGLSAPAEFAVSGSPITVSGTLALSWVNEAANVVLSGPTTGSSAAPTFRALVAADIPTLTLAKISDAGTMAAQNANAVAITGGTINNATIGASTANSGKFTTVSASGQITSTVTTGTAPLVIGSTTNVANLNCATLNGATFSAPGAIGGGTPSTGAFTTISASGAITSTVSSGSGPPFVVSSNVQVTNLNASQLVGATWVAPGTLGSTTPNTVAGTSVKATAGVAPVSGTSQVEIWATGGTPVVSLVNSLNTTARRIWDCVTQSDSFSIRAVNDAYAAVLNGLVFSGGQDGITLLSVPVATSNVFGHTASVTVGNAGKMQVVGTTTATGQSQISMHAASAIGPNLALGKSRNATAGSNTIVQNGDTLGSITGYGANGSTYDTAAQIVFEVDGTPGASSDMPGRIRFLTSADGSATLTERLKIDSAGLATFAAGITATGAVAASNLTAWSAFTPSRTGWTDVGSPTVTGRKCQIGNVCHFQVKVVPGTTVATVAGTSYIDLPITAAGIGGDASMTDLTTLISIGDCVVDAANSRVYVPTQTATGDTLTICGWYEV